MKFISYKKGYKYQLVADYTVKISIIPGQNITTKFIDLDTAGNLLIKQSYAWDGPSGPTIDSLNFMRGSLVHDGLYQLMRERHLDNNVHREPADRLLQLMCEEDGMTAIRAWWVYQGVHFGGGPAADPSSTKPVVKAPEDSQ